MKIDAPNIFDTTVLFQISYYVYAQGTLVYLTVGKKNSNAMLDRQQNYFCYSIHIHTPD